MGEDLRIRRTKYSIKQSFLKMLEEKDLEHITINEITQLAFCNRNTFYSHYEDKYDLIDKLCEESLKLLKVALKGLHEKKWNSPEELYLNISGTCFELMEEDMQFYNVVLGKNRYPVFAERYKSAITEYIFENVKLDKKNMKAIKIEIEFATNGLIGVHRYWLQNQEKYQKEEILEISKNLIVGLGKIIFEEM